MGKEAAEIFQQRFAHTAASNLYSENLMPTPQNLEIRKSLGTIHCNKDQRFFIPRRDVNVLGGDNYIFPGQGEFGK